MTGSHVPVLIVGGGPCGLGLAIELGWRGVPCLVVEQSDETIPFPTANLINTRTMEFLRRWGIADQARYECFPSDYPNTYLYLTGFNRHELVRFEHPGNGDPAARSRFNVLDDETAAPAGTRQVHREFAQGRGVQDAPTRTRAGLQL